MHLLLLLSSSQSTTHIVEHVSTHWYHYGLMRDLFMNKFTPVATSIIFLNHQTFLLVVVGDTLLTINSQFGIGIASFDRILG